MIWKEAIQNAQEVFESEGISDARTNAEFLALSVLGSWQRSELRQFLKSEQTSEQEKQFNSYVLRRLLHEPLQHIIGETEFFGLRFFVSPAALIPRVDTEILVEEILREAALLGRGELSILDIGTGSGIIPLAIGSQLDEAHLVGIDISQQAIDLSRKNQQRLNLANVSFKQMDLFDNDALSEYFGKVDILTSNPPYVSTQEMNLLDREVRDFEPTIALTDGGDGLRFYHRIAEIAPLLLKSDGRIIVEIGYDGAKRVSEIFERAGYIVIRTVKDIQNIDRVIVIGA